MTETSEQKARVLNRAFLRSSAVIAVAIAVMNVTTYAYTVIAAHTIGKDAYGAFSALMGALLVISVLSLGLQATGARRIAAHPDQVDAIEKVVLYVGLRSGLVLGAICLMDRDDDNSDYESPQMRLAESIAVLLAALLGTMQVAALRKELEVGRTIQNALLPERPPKIPGFDADGRYRHATHVGGDYFDFISAGHATYVVIADVSWHNLAPGMMSAMAVARGPAVRA